MVDYMFIVWNVFIYIVVFFLFLNVFDICNDLRNEQNFRCYVFIINCYLWNKELFFDFYWVIIIVSYVIKFIKV